MTNKISVTALVVAVIAFGVAAVGSTKTDERVVERVVEKVGATAAPDVYSYMRVHGPFEQGGSVNSIDPGDATYSLTAADMLDYNIITFDASTTQAALTATLPASTTFPLSPEKGATRTWVIENPFTAAATTTTIAAGTGVDLQEPDGQNVVIGINNYAYVTCTRGLDSGAPLDVVCKVDETIPAD